MASPLGDVAWCGVRGARTSIRTQNVVPDGEEEGRVALRAAEHGYKEAEQKGIIAQDRGARERRQINDARVRTCRACSHAGSAKKGPQRWIRYYW